MTKQWYQTLFENYGRKYKSESYVQGRPNLFYKYRLNVAAAKRV